MGEGGVWQCGSIQDLMERAGWWRGGEGERGERGWGVLTRGEREEQKNGSVRQRGSAGAFRT